MSRKKSPREPPVKCAYCGREGVPVTKKGYMKPHVKPDGRPCLFVLIPHRSRP